MLCPHCKKAGLKLPLKAWFSRRAVFSCADCGVETASELGGIVYVKNFIVGAVSMAVLAGMFVLFWGQRLLPGLSVVALFAVDAWLMLTLHRRNLRELASRQPVNLPR